MSTLASASVIVIGNPQLPISHLTAAQVSNIFLKKPVELGENVEVQPFNQPNASAVYSDFCKTILHWTPDQLSSYWASNIFNGESNPPQTVDNDRQAIAVVEGTPGAVSYIDSSALSLAQGNVKILYGDNNIVNQPKTIPPHKTKTVKKTKNTKKAETKHANNNKAAVKALKEKALAEVAAINGDLKQGKKTKKASPTVTSSNGLWQVITDDFKLQGYANMPTVRQQIIWFVNHKYQLQSMVNASSPYLFYIYQQVKARHMPAEFVILPMIESGYKPAAYSHSGATGLWQMMPATASSLGLEINWWYDGRRDTVVSTQASLNYLATLHSALHTWLLAAAAYDSGIGVVQNAQESNAQAHKGTDFWSLHLPAETENYVPKLLAIAQILKHPNYYGIQLPKVNNQSYFARITIKSQFDLGEISKLAQLPVATVQQLNPAIMRWATKPNGSYTLILPVKNAELFKAHLKTLSGKRHVSWQYHQVQRGETVASVAKMYRTSVDFLAQINHLRSNILPAGSGILVPVYLHRTYANPIPQQFVKPVRDVQVSQAPQSAQANKQSLKALIGKIYSH